MIGDTSPMLVEQRFQVVDVTVTAFHCLFVVATPDRNHVSGTPFGEGYGLAGLVFRRGSS